MTVENSTLNRDSTFNRTVRLIESTEYGIKDILKLLLNYWLLCFKRYLSKLPKIGNVFKYCAI